MAYLVSITPSCVRCGKKATVELRGRFNEVFGRYCATCGKAALVQQQQREDEKGA